MSLQKFIETVFGFTFFYRLRNVGPNHWSPMYNRFFCNRIIYNGKVRIKYLSRIMFMNKMTLYHMIESTRARRHTCTRTCICAHPHAHIWLAQTHSWTHTWTHRQTHARTYAHIHTRATTQTHAHACRRANIDTRIRWQICSHACTYANSRTCTLMPKYNYM